jgi:hypothetical protein
VAVAGRAAAGFFLLAATVRVARVAAVGLAARGVRRLTGVLLAAGWLAVAGADAGAGGAGELADFLVSSFMAVSFLGKWGIQYK